MFIPTRPNNTKILPKEFEHFVLSLLENAIEGVPNAQFQHNEIIKSSDGSFQIDGTIRFELMGVKYLTLVECKMYQSPISREKVQILYDKVRSIGAQKGILATTSYFQKGAIEYATAHGIALVQIVDGKLTYSARSRDIKITAYPSDIPKFVGLAQYKINPNSIGCVNIQESDYLLKFLLGNI